MLKVQFKGIEKMLRDLEKARKTAVPYAVKTALNSQAFEARAIWSRELASEFTLRNQFTQRSLQVVKASGRGDSIQASVGSTAPYMGEREEGGETHGRSGLKGIPGPAAAGQAPGTKRTRLVRGSNRLAALSALHVPVRGSKKRQNAAAIAMAVRQGKQVVLLNRQRGGKALFRVGPTPRCSAR